jgi:hypothetical protein
MYFSYLQGKDKINTSFPFGLSYLPPSPGKKEVQENHGPNIKQMKTCQACD